MTQLNSSYKRVETGVVQFDDDWPGIFIRGDHALGYALYLESYQQPGLIELAKLLRRCDATDIAKPVRRLTARVTVPK